MSYIYMKASDIILFGERYLNKCKKRVDSDLEKLINDQIEYAAHGFFGFFGKKITRDEAIKKLNGDGSVLWNDYQLIPIVAYTTPMFKSIKSLVELCSTIPDQSINVIVDADVAKNLYRHADD